ncbi:LCP family protein [Aquibacillus koreensis]|uniref:Polyisoprenyl-teichoic acid--peptidoglycan teichoic acid transferase TagU n=1 Tax=Aquibacillus koreensis TaxID=279446 RepID=A0A9X4AJB0_9BACI|nr:LCP family protein [Aquibacillus koreensis]MCT2537236.1 LCP family protein [Aquibacillus koreensis]MDC3421584.1 LCP family protein [Aquibacillus koreensis]
MPSRIEKKKISKKRKVLYWIGGIILTLLLLGIGYGVYVYTQLDNAVEAMHEPLSRDMERQKEMDNVFKSKESFNILLLGVDERSTDKGRSDTMVFMSLNPRTDSMIMMSIPRDTYVDIPGRGMDKINHAYAFGGSDLTLNTVEQVLDVPIHFYSKINMEGFIQGVDAIGGVTVNNSFAFDQDGESFAEGNIRLNGEQALKYTRMRKQDPRGDFGRNDRQRQVIQAAIDEAADFSSVTKVGNILDILGGNVKTNLEMDNLQTLFSDYRQTRKNVNNIQIEGSGSTIGRIWYYVVPDAEWDRIQTEIKTHMEAK